MKSYQQTRTAHFCLREESRGGHVRIGKKVPDFTLSSVDGHEVKLSDFRGTKVMVCFYKFSTCTVDAYAINQLMGEYKKLAWASKLKVIAIFHTNVECLKKGLSDSEELFGKHRYPFVALADPDGSTAAKFQVERTAFIKQLISGCKNAPGTCKDIVRNRVMRKDAFSNAGSFTFLPSEYLIDKDGTLVDVMRAKKSNEHMSLDRVGSFLLHGRRCPTIFIQNKYGQMAKERSRYSMPIPNGSYDSDDDCDDSSDDSVQ